MNRIMRTSKISFLLILLLLLGGALSSEGMVRAQSGAPDSLTLGQAIHAALTNQPSLQEVEAQIAASESKVEQARSGLYPKVDVEGSYSFVRPVSSIEFNGNAVEVMPGQNYDAHVAARQLLYDFGKTKESIALARSKTLTEKQRLDVVKWTLSYYTAQTFYSVLYLDQSIRVVDQQLATIGEDLDLTKKKRKNGSATDYDVLSLQVRISEIHDHKLDLEGQKENMLIRLRKLFGWETDHPLKLVGTLEMKPEASVGSYQAIYGQRPDYSVLEHRKETLMHSYELVKLSERPQLSAGVNAGFRNGFQPNLDEFRGNYSLGLQVRIPIFNGFLEEHRKDEVKAQMQALDAAAEKLKRRIQHDVATAQEDIRIGKQKLQSTELRIRQAEERLRLAKIKYANGVITNTDLITAETALTKAKFERVTSIYHILLSQYDLKKARGEKIWLAQQ
jgi:outer membrane protein